MAEVDVVEPVAVGIAERDSLEAVDIDPEVGLQRSAPVVGPEGELGAVGRVGAEGRGRRIGEADRAINAGRDFFKRRERDARQFHRRRVPRAAQGSGSLGSALGTGVEADGGRRRRLDAVDFELGVSTRRLELREQSGEGVESGCGFWCPDPALDRRQPVVDCGVGLPDDV